jgi:hypothetical protein
VPGAREAWSLDFAQVDDPRAGDGSWVAGFVRLELRRDAGVAWYWAYLVGTTVGLVVVRDHEVPLPRGEQLVVRAEGLWAELVCETPGEHWSVGLEAFGVRLDDPADGFRGEIGERLAVGLDVEWEVGPGAVPGAAALDGTVYGAVLVGRDRIALDGTGTFGVERGSRAWATTEGVAADLGPDGIPRAVTRLVGGAPVPVEVLGTAALPLGAPGGGGLPRLVRVLGRWTGDDGATKVGWVDLVEHA